MLTRPTLRPTAFLVLPLALILSSCGLWDSVTAYFNTYYNAQRVYEEAEDELWAQKDLLTLGRGNYLTKFATPNRAKFTQVIEKCSKLLQYYPDSRLVDDALFMIGMSSYYQGDYQQANRKFRELIEQFPDGNYVPRGTMMLAYTQFQLMKPDSASAIALRLYEAATEDGDDAMIGQSAMLLGEIERERENRPKAVEFFTRAGETCEDPEMRSTANMIAGQIAEEIPDYAAAESAYLAASKSSRIYAGEFKGLLGVARMRARQGDYQGALERLDELRDNMNYREFFGDVSYEVGNVHRMSGDIEGAVFEYKYVDTAFARTESAAKACYELGLLYETKLNNLDSARVAYTRGKSYTTVGTVGPILARKAEILGLYTRYRNDLVRLDSVRGAMLAKRDSVIALRDSVEKLARANPEKPDSALLNAVKILVPPNVDSIATLTANTRIELATLFYVGLGMPDSAEYWYRKFLRDSPLHPAVPRALFTLAQMAGEDSTRAPADSLYQELIRRFPETDFADEARKVLGLPPVARSRGEVETEYGAASDMIQAGKYPEAVAALRNITTNFPTSPLAPRAQYAIGWLYENALVTPDSAIANYQLLVSKYPTSSFVALVQPKLVAVQAARSGVKADSVKTSQAVPDSLTTQKRVLDEPASGRARRLRQEQPQKPAREPERD